MQVPFDATVLKQGATELRIIKAECRGVVSEKSIEFAAKAGLPVGRGYL